MNVENKTSLPLAEIKTLIKFAASLHNIDKVHFRIGWINQFARRSTFRPPDLVTIRLKKTGFPTSWGYALKGEPRLEVHNWQEALIHIAAHELTHLMQYRRSKRYSELDAQIIGNNRVKEWRKKNIAADTPTKTLKEIGVDFAQGFHTGRPMPIIEFFESPQFKANTPKMRKLFAVNN